MITCLAESLGFDAVGIEIESQLVDIAEAFAEVHGIDVAVRARQFPAARRGAATGDAGRRGLARDHRPRRLRRTRSWSPTNSTSCSRTRGRVKNR